MIKVVCHTPRGEGLVRVNTFKFNPDEYTFWTNREVLCIGHRSTNNIIAMFQNWVNVTNLPTDPATSSSAPGRNPAADEAADEPTEDPDRL